MIVCLEGINGSGKSTLAESLVAAWKARGGAAMRVDPVQHTPFGQQVHAAIMTTTDLHADAETLAFTSARLHSGPLVSQLSQRPGTLVIIERWSGAIAAYGRVAGSARPLMKALQTALSRVLEIDQTFVVDTPGEEAARRLRNETDPNRFETIGAAYLEKVRQAYLSWARESGAVILDTAVQEDRTVWAAEFTAAHFTPAHCDVG